MIYLGANTAAKNATLAWFGGGSLAANGLGMKAGKLMLGGVVLGPVLAVAGFVMAAKSKEKLANAREVNAEAKKSVEQMNNAADYMKGIADITDNYSDFIMRFGKKFEPFIDELCRIRSEKAIDGQVDFDSLTEAEQKTLHLSWIMAQIYYQLLCSPILDQEGNIEPEAKPALDHARSAFAQLEKETYHMDGEFKEVGALIWGPKAKQAMIYGFMIMGFLIAFGVLTFRTSVLCGMLTILDAAVACPIFFKFTDMGMGKLTTWRYVRMVIAIVLLVMIQTMI